MNKEQIEKCKVEELRKMAVEKGLDTEGKKADLVERLVACTYVEDVTDTDVAVSESDTVKVKVLKTYKDKCRECMQYVDEEFEVDPERAKVLFAAGVAKVIE